MVGRDDPPRDGAAASLPPRASAASSLQRDGAAPTAQRDGSPLGAAADFPPRQPAAGTAREGAGEDPGAPEATAPAIESESIFGVLQGLLHELPGLVSDRIELFSLEVKRAGRAMAQIVALAMAIAVLGIATWIALWVQIAWWLWQAGWPWLPVVLVVHLAAMWFAFARVKTLARLLGLPATRRHLTVGLAAASAAVSPPPEPGAEPIRAAPASGAAGAAHG